MASLVVGGVTIPVAVSSPAFTRDEAADRGRSFDGSYFASETGGAADDWTFSTPPVTPALAATYKAALTRVGAQLCSGDILEQPKMCFAEFPGGKPLRKSSGHLVVLDFALHEAIGATTLFSYDAGDTVAGSAFTRSTSAKYRNSAGIVATAAIDVIRDAHYDASDLTANSPSTLLEGAATNVVIHNRDLSPTTGATWTRTNMTVTKNQIGADGTANGACALVADAANATVTQQVTLASSQRAMSAYVFRGVGTGPVEMTTDGGTTWTPITLTGGYTRVRIPAQTLANPNFGFRIVTSGDAIGVDFVQNETGAVPTSPIETTTVAVTRGADLYSLPFTDVPRESTVYVKMIDRGTINTSAATAFLIANAASASPAFAGYAPGGVFAAVHLNGGSVTSTLGVAPVYEDTIELAARLLGDGSVNITQSINGGAETTATQSAALAFATAWSGQLLWPNGSSASVRGFAAYKSIKVVAGSRSLAEMRVL